MDVAIIGAGIAGLTLAIALQKANISFTIYESSKEIKPVGAGIAIANNAMQVYRHLGIVDQLNKKGTPISTIKLTDYNLNVLDQTELTAFENYYQLANIAIHRSELHQVLLNNIDSDKLILNKRLQNIEQCSDGTHKLFFTDNTTVQHSYIFGADGIRSMVRKAMFSPTQLRDAKQICWRGVLDYQLPTNYNHTALEGWGKGKRFGFVKLDKQQVYWYFLVNESLYNKTPTLVELSNDCHPLVKDLILQTESSAIYLDKIYDLKPINTWYKNRVCLIGDAAHATTPNLGQGACQAIEDVYVISKLLEKHTLDEALQHFTPIRRSKAHAIVRDSWALGQVAQFQNPILATGRNTIFKLLPSFLKDKQMKTMFELQKV